MSTPVETGNPILPLAHWDEGTQDLVLEAVELLQVGTQAVLRLAPQQARIRLPPRGIGKNSMALTLSTDAALGPVSVPQSIGNNGPTGAFSDTRASFFPPAAGEIVEIHIEFTVWMPMQEYDQIILILTDFEGPFLETVARGDLRDLDRDEGVWHAIWSKR